MTPAFHDGPHRTGTRAPFARRSIRGEPNLACESPRFLQSPSRLFQSLPLRSLRFLCVLAFFLALSLSLPARAQQREDLERSFVIAFNDGDYPLAERHARAWVKLRPDDFIPHFNLACALARQDLRDAAAAELDTSIALGMTSKFRLLRDASILRLKGHETYERLLATWPEQLERAIDARLERARKAFPKSYLYDKDHEWRMAFACGFDQQALDAARAQMKAVVDWWAASVLPDGAPLVRADGSNPDPWVMISLPARAEYDGVASGNLRASQRQPDNRGSRKPTP